MRWWLVIAVVAGCGASGASDAGCPEWDASACACGSSTPDAGAGCGAPVCAVCLPNGNFGGELCRNPLPACTTPGTFHDCDVGSALGPYCCTCEPGGRWRCNLYCPPSAIDMSVTDGGGGD